MLSQSILKVRVATMLTGILRIVVKKWRGETNAYRREEEIPVYEAREDEGYEVREEDW